MKARRMMFALPLLVMAALHCATASPDPTRLKRLTATIEVWGNVQKPIIVEQDFPKYPDIRGRVSGIVIVEVWIREDGTVGDVRALKPLPFGMTEAAIEAVRKWRFAPGRVNGRPVPVVQNVTVTFKL